ncbi:MAG: PaaX family transcriptional regulator [Acidimicrobiales bacterium]
MRLTTLFGDALLPRAAATPVRALAALVDPLGVNDRLLRTSLTRLTGEGLVVADRVGRESHYRVAPDAIHTFEQANQRIYLDRQPSWDGDWTVAVIDPSAPADDRLELGRELAWGGLTALANTAVFVSPTVSVVEVESIALRHLSALAVLTRGPVTSGSLRSDDTARQLLDPDGSLRAAIDAFIATYEPIVGDLTTISPADALTLRTLMVDDWRRVALRSPELPAKLIPDDWPATDARSIAAAIYRRLADPSETHLTEMLGVPPPGVYDTIERRFGPGVSARA